MPREAMFTMGKLRAWSAALAVSAVVLGVWASSAAAVPANFWGVVPQETPTVERFQRLKQGGVDSIRVPIEWGALQPVKGGAPNWATPDTVIGRAATAGIEVLPFITGAPAWAVPSVPVPGAGASKAPAHLPASGAAGSAWTTFLKEAVARYGPNGAFWTANPTIPARPIRTWQVWNEPNFKYFVTKPNPAEYGRLVKLSYPAIKSVDPGAKVVLAGLFARPKEAVMKFKPPRAYFATDFLERMYKSTPGVKSKFNGVALHPYTYDFPELTEDIEDLRATLKKNRDPGKGIWITELGWSSQPPNPNNLFAKGPGGQAKQLRGAFSLLKRNQVKWKLKQLFWFSVDDQKGVCNFCDGSGLFGDGFVPKKSWFEYVKFAGGTP
jgi:polysaccharide biosynthesis protein PslG